MSEKTKIFIVSALIAAVGIFFIATIRPGHGWGDDFSQYIHHAINIAQGTPYQQTGYIYNPSYSLLGPAIYPPGFPLLLVPVYKIFGLNFTAFKIEIITLFLACLLLTYLLLKDKLGFKYLLSLIVLIGFNPFFWNFKDSVLSDIPFFFWAFLGLFLIDQCLKKANARKFQWLFGIGLALVFYLAFATRTLGIVLPACLVSLELLKTKKISPLTIIALAFFAVLVIGQASLLSDSSYLDQFSGFGVKSVVKSFLISAKALIFFWGSSSQAISLGVIIALLASAGFITRIKEKKFAPCELFLIFYVLAIGLWPSNQGARFLIPIIPLFLFYAFYSLQKIGKSRLPRKIGQAIFILLVSAIFVSYVGRYIAIGFGPVSEGPFRKESVELFEHIKQNTNHQDVFIFAKPRALALFTGRSAAALQETNNDQQLWDYLNQISADYLIQGQRVLASNFLNDFILRNQAGLEPVYSNPDFVVYKIIRKTI